MRTIIYPAMQQYSKTKITHQRSYISGISGILYKFDQKPSITGKCFRHYYWQYSTMYLSTLSRTGENVKLFNPPDTLYVTQCLQLCAVTFLISNHSGGQMDKTTLSSAKLAHLCFTWSWITECILSVEKNWTENGLYQAITDSCRRLMP
jgi:hypothetical protein